MRRSTFSLSVLCAASLLGACEAETRQRTDGGRPRPGPEDAGTPPIGRDGGPPPTPRDAAGVDARPPIASDGSIPLPADAWVPPALEFHDPGSGPWTLVPEAQVASECGIDPALLDAADRAINTAYAIVRYGKLCHEYLPAGNDPSAEVWSATKTLGALVTGIAAYETRDIPRTGARTGPIRFDDRADHWLPSFTFNREARLAHVLAMVGHNASLDYDGLVYAYDTVGTTQINRLSDVVNAAIAQDSARLGANIEAFTRRFLFEPLGMTNSTWSNNAATKNYAYSWSSTLRDMARVGLLIMHRGIYDGERVLDEAWIYRMTHPSFESANTAYGYLTWLNARAGGTGPGGAGTGVGGDPCAPAAVWQRYPHALSEAANCDYGAQYSCAQQYDVGVWSAQGLGGQFIVGHAGLDMVIVAKNYGGGGPQGLWTAIRPALVAEDPMFQGNAAAFCTAYGSNSYAPDLIGTATQPTP